MSAFFRAFKCVCEKALFFVLHRWVFFCLLRALLFLTVLLNVHLLLLPLYKTRAYPVLRLAFELQPCYSLCKQGFLTDTYCESVQTYTMKMPLFVKNLTLPIWWTSARKAVKLHGSYRLCAFDLCTWREALFSPRVEPLTALWGNTTTYCIDSDVKALLNFSPLYRAPLTSLL